MNDPNRQEFEPLVAALTVEYDTIQPATPCPPGCGQPHAWSRIAGSRPSRSIPEQGHAAQAYFSTESAGMSSMSTVASPSTTASSASSYTAVESR